MYSVTWRFIQFCSWRNENKDPEKEDQIPKTSYENQDPVQKLPIGIFFFFF